MQDSELLTWFDAQARPFLENYAPDRTKSLVSDARRLEVISSLPTETVVCCLGTAGVGKSTLINALVGGDRQLLPSGGVGPLTALATTVRFGERKRFRAKYHRPKYLWQIVLPLMGAVLRERSGLSPDSRSLAPAPDSEISDQEVATAVEEGAKAVEGETGRLNDFSRM